MRFSQRIGRRPVKSVLQIESIDEDLLNGLWNVILEEFFHKMSKNTSYGSDRSNLDYMCLAIWKDYFKKRVDKFYGASETLNFIEEWFFYKSDFLDKYDFIEYLAIAADYIGGLDFKENCNIVLKRELSGYRIINSHIVQITSEEEIAEIEEALENVDRWKSVSEHLETSLELLGDKKKPDYRNSIKEAISAVESFCKIITQDDKATLGKALAMIESSHSLHGSLKEAFSKLYGFTSDTGGIRHSLTEGDREIPFEEAKFMLVSCSAFINYLKFKFNSTS